MFGGLGAAAPPSVAGGRRRRWPRTTQRARTYTRGRPLAVGSCSPSRRAARSSGSATARRRRRRRVVVQVVVRAVERRPLVASLVAERVELEGFDAPTDRRVDAADVGRDRAPDGSARRWRARAAGSGTAVFRAEVLVVDLALVLRASHWYTPGTSTSRSVGVELLNVLLVQRHERRKRPRRRSRRSPSRMPAGRAPAATGLRARPGELLLLARVALAVGAVGPVLAHLEPRAPLASEGVAAAGGSRNCPARGYSPPGLYCRRPLSSGRVCGDRPRGRTRARPSHDI